VRLVRDQADACAAPRIPAVRRLPVRVADASSGATCVLGVVIDRLLAGSAVGARRSEDGAARGYFNGGDAAAVQHQYPITVPGSECARVLGKR
jgi:hypothetical protein